ncbi:MAG: SLC13 family permease [Rhodopila sp.]
MRTPIAEPPPVVPVRFFMTAQQGAAFAIVAAMLALFAWDRLRYDLVAALALSAAALAGVVPARDAFTGFSNPVVIVIAAVLVIGRAIEGAGIIEAAVRRPLQALRSTSLQVGTLTASVTLLSAFMKNVGTLGVFIPIALRTAKRCGRSPSLYLMPMAFGSLVGGTITQIGTSPNLLISEVRRQLSGAPFRMFDFTPVGLPLALVGIAFLAAGWRLIPRRDAPQPRKAAEEYTSEATVAAESSLVGSTVRQLEEQGGGDLTVIGLIRDHDRQSPPDPATILAAGDLLLLQVDPVVLRPLLDQKQLDLAGEHDLPESETHDESLETAEAVVLAQSALLGRTARGIGLRRRHGLNLLAIGRNGRQIRTRLRDTRFRAGDLLILQGRGGALGDTLTVLGCLPLSERNLAPRRRRSGIVSMVILAMVLAAAAARLVPVDLAFFLGAVAVVAVGAVTLREAYEAVEWPIIVMLGCLIPVGEALHHTGAADLMADVLSSFAGGLPGILALGLMLVASMVVTPFLHHAAAVLVMGPVAAVVAGNLGLHADAFLMAVAVGASCDFLTPIGHQNNLLVMGPGGYRFGDYWRLGLPLSCLVAVLGTGLIAWWWGV